MTAHIRSLHTYPIKSCAGIDLTSSVIDRSGLANDRSWMLVVADERFMTQRQWLDSYLVERSGDTSGCAKHGYPRPCR